MGEAFENELELFGFCCGDARGTERDFFGSGLAGEEGEVKSSVFFIACEKEGEFFFGEREEEAADGVFVQDCVVGKRFLRAFDNQERGRRLLEVWELCKDALADN